ncbi:MAG: hypothetical protein IJY57_04700 [Clostridia bacterium]|nr:hypothetical protein [Clostridia bacterium]
MIENKPKRKTKKALKEVNDIMCGKKQAKKYNDINELMKSLNDEQTNSPHIKKNI